MIISRYIQRNIHLGTLGALLVLVSLSLLFQFVREIDDIGDRDYGLVQAIEYLALSIPGTVVDFLPLAVLLGGILSLGALAGNSEIIAMQASGVSMGRLLASVLQAALVLALAGFLLGDWIVPDSEAAARDLKNLAKNNTTALHSSEGLWIKDELRVVHVQALLPNGFARNIEIFTFDKSGKLLSTLHAASAIPGDDGWELRMVSESVLSTPASTMQYHDRMKYSGNLSPELLQVMMIRPRKMSSLDLLAYLNFLEENQLDSRSEQLIFWKKIFAPLSVVVMGLLALPFVLGSQRQSGGGQRLLIGILLGLAFVVIDQLFTQVGSHFGIGALLVALLPNLLFFAFAIYLLIRRPHGTHRG